MTLADGNRGAVAQPARTPTRTRPRAAFARLRGALSAGEVRAAEPDAAAPSGWRVNAWVKQGILLGFRFGDIVDMSADHGRWPFFDKDTLPLKRLDVAAGVRIVPGGSTVRDGAYLGRGVICMPPMYINIGAYVGDGTLVDSHALVGSCAQIGSRVHLSAAAQIGGVLEPVGALPVVIEDDVLVGGNCGVYEGAIVKRRAVLAAGVILTGSTPVYDLPNDRIIEPSRASRSIDSGRRGRRAGRAAGHVGQGPRVGAVGRDADHREVPRRADGRADGARAMDPIERVAFARALIDIDSTTGREAGGGDVAGRAAARARLHGQSSSRSSAAAPTSWRRSTTRRSSSRRTSTACRRSFRAASRTAGCTDAARATRRASWRRRSRRPSGCAPRASAASGCCSSSARSAAATGRRPPTRSPIASRFLINGEPTDSGWRRATRGELRVRLRAAGRAAHSAAPEQGESAIDKLDRRARAAAGDAAARRSRPRARRSTASG